ncbi:MAG: AAA family ATPase [Lachnospiraceae bacterium]|nr:AAA family ATPase [Lachnospiraceae bacterium]
MRLVSCHIDNFGKISGLDHSFDQGTNIIHEDNGWGKSTLATFIRVMFYGFLGERTRDENENERKKYYPWQSGAYGGNIVFSVRGKTYRLERFFDAKKAASDIFRLYDNDTNLESDDYSVNIGEQLFGIDIDSFLNTVFIRQQSCGTDVTSGVKAKIGDVSDETADMGNYDDAYQKIKKTLDSLTPNRATGRISKLDSSIAILKEEIRGKDALKANLDEMERKMGELKEERSALEKKKASLQEQINTESTRNDIRVEAEKYNAIINSENAVKEKYDEKLKFFPGEVPDAEKVEDIILVSEELETVIRQRDDNSFTEDEKASYEISSNKFSSGIPSEDDIDSMEEAINDLDRAKSRENERAIRVAEDIRKNRNASVIRLTGLAVAIVLLAVAGALLIFTEDKTVPVILFVAGVLLGLIPLLFVKKIKTDPEEGSAKELIAEEEDRVEDFFERFGYGSSDASYQKRLFSLKSEKGSFKRLMDKKERYDEAERKADILRTTVKEFMSGYGFTVTENVRQSLMKIRDHAKDVKELGAELEAENKKRQRYEEEHDVSKFTGGSKEGSVSLEDLNGQLNDLIDRIEGINRSESQLKDNIGSSSEKLELIENREIELKEKEEEREALFRQFDLMSKTRDFLEKAKESFSSKYMVEILESFEKYHDMISESGEKYELDANLNIKLKDIGGTHDIRSLSEGYQDMVGLCRRMAMVDAMYDLEKPFLIFDDPFVNLDESRLKGAMDFLDRLGSTYQIIYFSCHESRCISGP